MFEIYRQPKGRAAPILGLFLGILGTLTFLFLFYVQYWKWRDCLEENGGRCFDPVSMVVYTDAGFVWGCFSVPFLVLVGVSLVVLIRRSRVARP